MDSFNFSTASCHGALRLSDSAEKASRVHFYDSRWLLRQAGSEPLMLVNAELYRYQPYKIHATRVEEGKWNHR